MSELYSKLNTIVAVALTVAVCSVVYMQLPGSFDDKWFQADVIERHEPVLVKFGAEWCGPCRMMEPVLDQLQSKLGERLGVVRVNIDQYRNLAQQYNVSSIPQLCLFQHGKVVAQRVGYADEQDLMNWIAAHVTE